MDYQSEINYLLEVWINNPRLATQIIKKQRPELFDKINNCVSGKTFSEKSWKWVHYKNETHEQSCYCGNPVKYLDFRRGYALYCCVKCMSNAPSQLEKRKDTITKRYGVSHFSKTDEYKTKFKNTCLRKYGVINPGQIIDKKLKRARNKQLTFFNALIEKIKNEYTPKFNFEQYTHLRDKSLLWQCLTCNNNFESNLLNKLPKCPVCYPTRLGCPSSIEKEIQTEIKKFYFGEILENSRNIINPKELDIFFPKEKFAIEVNGIYWHRTEKVGSNYHYNKYVSCLEKEISLLMITDHEWRHHKELILRMIRHRLGLQKIRIFAKNCHVREISVAQAKAFLSTNHLHGFGKASVHLGLYQNTTLVAVCSVSTKNRFKKNSNSVEIIRFALGDLAVVGALGKFIHKIKEIYPSRDIETYADLRYGSGLVYTKNNFVETHTTKPGYWYYYNGELKHRLCWTKQKLVKMGFDRNLTEVQIMNLIGATQIFDCGHKHFILRNQK